MIQNPTAPTAPATAISDSEQEVAAALFDLKNFIPAPAPLVQQARGEAERGGMGGREEEVEQAVVAKSEPDDHIGLAPEVGKGRGNSREAGGQHTGGGKTAEGMRSPSVGCVLINNWGGGEA